MAKFGEGDTRWIVNDVGNATNNDNGWHWKEYDALEWSSKKLQEMFKSVTLFDNECMNLIVTSMHSCDGEAFINNRKSKLIPSYELEVKFWWKGEGKDGDGKVASLVHGSIHCPYIADENADEDPEIKFICENEEPLSRALKEKFQSAGKKVFIEKINAFVAELRAGGPVSAKQLAQDKADDKPTPTASDPTAKPAAKVVDHDRAASASKPASKPETGEKKGTRKLQMSEKFYAKPSDIYECFTVVGKIMAYTQSGATCDPKPGGTFSWFGGSVHGEFLEMEKDKHLVMKWKFNTWADNAWSKVDICLEQPEVGTTILTLNQTGIPEEDKFHQPVLDMTTAGWKDRILTRIRQVFGYGV